MRYTDISDEFHSFESGEPFKNCKMCDKDLTAPDTHYLIEKAVRKYTGYKAWDVVFEYAICMECANNFRKQLSSESIQSIEKYFIDNVDFSRHQQRLKEEVPNISAFTSTCLVKGFSKEDVEEYQIYGECRGNQFIYGAMPYMISGQVMDEVANLLSAKTLDELDGFAEKHLGPSPELEGLFKGKKLVLI